MASPQTFWHRQTSCIPSVMSVHAIITRDLFQLYLAFTLPLLNSIPLCGIHFLMSGIFEKSKRRDGNSDELQP